MRALNIIGIVLVIVLFVVIGVYVDATISARWSSFFNDLEGDGYHYASYGRAADLTMEAAGIMVVFVLFFTGAMIANLVKIKTLTSKVMAIIGLSFSLLILLVNLMVFSSPSNLTFDESGGFFFIYGLICLAFFIVFLVQSVRYRKRKVKKVNHQIIDEEIF